MTFVHDFSLFLYDKGILKFGRYTLSSGQESQYYIDLRKVLGYPREYSMMIKMLAAEIARRHGSNPRQVLVGVPTGGLAIAASVAILSHLPLAYVRKAPKSYGSGNQVEGAVLTHESEAILIDDVISTGGSLFGALVPLWDNGLAPQHVYTIVDRMMGGRERLARHDMTLHSLLTIEDIVTCLQDEGRISEEVAESVRAAAAAASPPVAT